MSNTVEKEKTREQVNKNIFSQGLIFINLIYETFGVVFIGSKIADGTVKKYPIDLPSKEHIVWGLCKMKGLRKHCMNTVIGSIPCCVST